jgi:hypothetical protein
MPQAAVGSKPSSLLLFLVTFAWGQSLAAVPALDALAAEQLGAVLNIVGSIPL